MSSEYGKLRPTNGWDLLASLGHPSKFQQVSCLGSVTARHSSSGCQPNFAAFNRGRHLSSAGRPSRWALAHILFDWRPQKSHDKIAGNARISALIIWGQWHGDIVCCWHCWQNICRPTYWLLRCVSFQWFDQFIAHLSKHKMCSAGLAFALLLCYLRDFHYLHLYSPNR